MEEMCLVVILCKMPMSFLVKTVNNFKHFNLETYRDSLAIRNPVTSFLGRAIRQ